MTDEQFWHGDPTLIFDYQNAYMSDLHLIAHIQGYYDFIGLTTALGNAFRKKGQKAEEYPKKPLYEPKKKVATKNARQEYKAVLRNQMSWLNSVSGNQ